MNNPQLTLSLDAPECRRDETRIVYDAAIAWANGDKVRAIAWVDRAAKRLDEERERDIRVWESKRQRHLDDGFPEEGFKLQKPGIPRAKHAILAEVKKMLEAA